MFNCRTEKLSNAAMCKNRWAKAGVYSHNCRWSWQHHPPDHHANAQKCISIDWGYIFIRVILLVSSCTVPPIRNLSNTLLSIPLNPWAEGRIIVLGECYDRICRVKNQGTAPQRRNSSLLLSSYSHVNDFVFNVHSYGIAGKIILFTQKKLQQLSAPASSSNISGLVT